MKLDIAVLPGDGVGPEVTTQAVKVLKAIAVEFDHEFIFKKAAVGAAAIESFKNPLPDSTLEICHQSDAILFGTISDAPDHIDSAIVARPEQGLLQLRKKLDLFADIRNVQAYDALLDRSPLKADVLAGTNISIYRELTGGIYFNKKELSDDGNWSSDLCVYSRPEIERIAHLAFEAARARRRKLTLIDKANVLETSRLWRSVVKVVARSYPDVALELLYVDKAAMQMIANPRSFDVVLIENLFGDIIAEELSALGGTLGLLTGASIGERHAMFRPVHGAMMEITGKNIANPVASILSAAMLLEHFELYSEAEMIRTAVHRSLELKIMTPDLNDTYNNITTSKVGEFITDFIANPADSDANFNNIHLGQSTII